MSGKQFDLPYRWVILIKFVFGTNLYFGKTLQFRFSYIVKGGAKVSLEPKQFYSVQNNLYAKVAHLGMVAYHQTPTLFKPDLLCKTINLFKL